ncbi:MAG: hypothetical protein EBQ82_06265 [Betaproteobacteria bacterium]|nr:hypothetical protein [Betaproteobacteria bacterium]NBY04988.1 hypothetical protein [Betaproteobacteria bacterium]
MFAKNIRFLWFKLMFLCCAPVWAESAEAQSPSEAGDIWLNPGFISYHFPKEGLSFNNENSGLGIEWRQSQEVSWSGGFFHNSDWERSYYVGAYWTPWVAMGWRWGAFIGVVDGYPKMLNGGAFPFLTPVATREWQRWGVGVSLLPDYENRLHGALTVQIKYKWKP